MGRNSPRRIRAPKSPRKYERELAEFARFIVQQASQRFINGVLTLPNYEVEKFATDMSDAFTDSNWAREAQKNANRVTRQIMGQLSDDRIRDVVAGILTKADGYNRQALYTALSPALGIDTANLMRDGSTVQIQALMDETTLWIQQLRGETLRKMTLSTLHMMAEGRDLDYIQQRALSFARNQGKHATFLARNQIETFNGLSNKIRAQRLGIEEAIWSTSADDSVRPSHADRDGKTFKIAEGCYSSLDGEYMTPGVDFNCRCDQDLLIPTT